MASLSTISPRLAQVVFEPVLRQRPRSPSLSRISRPSTPASSSRTHRRCVSASTSVSALLASPPPMYAPSPGSETFAHDRGRALRRRTPHIFNDDSNATTASSIFGANNHADMIIPLPPPFTPPTMATAVVPRPAMSVTVVQHASPSTSGSALFDVNPACGRGSRSAPVSPRLRPRRNSLPSFAPVQTLSPAQTPRFPPSPCLLDTIFSPKPHTTPAMSPNLHLPADLTNLVHIDTPKLMATDPKSARAIPPHLRPQITVESTSMAHTLRLPLPGYAPDEVTITVVPGEEGERDELRVVVDRWGVDVESEQGYLEYRVRFDESARLGGVQAGFRDGRLRLTVPRDI